MSVQFTGTTIEKVGAAIPLRFIIAVAGGYDHKEQGGQPALSGDTQAITTFNGTTLGKSNKIDVSSWKAFYKSLDIKLSGKEIEAQNQYMKGTDRTNKTIKLVIGQKVKLDNLAEWLTNTYKQNIKITQNKDGQTVVFKTEGVEDGSVKFFIGLEVASYDPKIGATGTISSSKAQKWMGTPASGFGTYTIKGFSKKAKVDICMDFGKCKSSATGIGKLGFEDLGGGKYRSKNYFKLTAGLANQLQDKKFMYSHTENVDGTLTVKPVGFCAAMISEFCAIGLEDVQDIGDNDDPEKMTPLTKGLNVKKIGDANIKCQDDPAGGEVSRCTIDAKFRQPIYDLLAKHMAASGFSRILPGSFKPISLVRNTKTGSGADYQYQFYGYEMTGEYMKVTNVASESVKLWEIGGEAGGGKIRLIPIIPKSLKKVDGSFEYETTKNLAFATTVEDLKKLNKDFAEEKYLFNAEVYASVVRETITQMAEVWHQTAQLTLNDPRESKEHIINSRVIKDKLLDNGGTPHDAFLMGTRLDMKGFLFNTFSTLAAKAGFKMGTRNIKFQADIAARELTEDTEGNAESGKDFTWTATSSITIDDFMQFLANDPDTDGELSSNFQDMLKIDLPTISDGVYDVDDIQFSYEFTWWNNWKFELDIDKDWIEGPTWEELGLKATWDIEDGKMLTLSKKSDGNRYGLDVSWRIDAKKPATYAQRGLTRWPMKLIDGAVIKSGFIFDADTGLPEFSLSLSKELMEGVNASISLTDASITAQWEGDFRYGRHSKIDVGITGGFGKSFDLLKKTGLKRTAKGEIGNPVEEGIKTVVGKNGSGGKEPYDLGFYDANLNLDISSNLFRLGNNLGNIVFDVKSRTDLTQAKGVIQGIALTSVWNWKLTYQNQICSTLLGMPANVHPHLGGQIGFTMQDVESSYWGTNYSGYVFTIGTGTFGISIVSHTRKDVIDSIIERKKYGKLEFPLAGFLEAFDFFGWVTDEETDEDYIARAWPCLVYNVINWQKEDYKKQLEDDIKKLKDRVDTNKTCEMLKALPGVGKSFEDFYNQEYGTGYPYLSDVADAFFNGGSHWYLRQWGLETGAYQKGMCPGELCDKWYHWTRVPLLKGIIGGKVYFDLRPEYVQHGTNERRPEVKVPSFASAGDWINQNGVVLKKGLVDAVRGFNPFWNCPILPGESSCQDPLQGFPNMPADGLNWIGNFYPANSNAFLNSACHAFMYMMREIVEFHAPNGYCSDSDNMSQCEPCKSLIDKWKYNEIATNQTKNY